VGLWWALSPRRRREGPRQAAGEEAFGTALAIDIALKEMSLAPAFSTTAPTYLSTAFSSRASTCAASATPPRSTMSAATASALRRVRPLRKSFAPSRAKCTRDGGPDVPSGLCRRLDLDRAASGLNPFVG
jgi:uncharacterized protein (DUF486 family)